MEELHGVGHVQRAHGRAHHLAIVAAAVGLAVVQVDGLQRGIFVGAEDGQISRFGLVEAQLRAEDGKERVLPAHEVLLRAALGIICLGHGHESLRLALIQATSNDIHHSVVELVVGIPQPKRHISQVLQRRRALRLGQPRPELGGIVTGIALAVRREQKDRQLRLRNQRHAPGVIVRQISRHGLLCEARGDFPRQSLCKALGRAGLRAPEDHDVFACFLELLGDVPCLLGAGGMACSELQLRPLKVQAVERVWLVPEDAVGKQSCRGRGHERQGCIVHQAGGLEGLGELEQVGRPLCRHVNRLGW